MSYQGKNLVGYYEPLDIYVKLMECPVLKWPLLVELEKKANTLEEAVKYERDLLELSQQFNIQDHLVKEEPSSLLYTEIFCNEHNRDDQDG